MVQVAMRGRRFAARFVAEHRSESGIQYGKEYEGDREYTLHFWKGTGKIVDRVARKTHVFNFSSGSTERDLRPLEETIIRFEPTLEGSSIVVKDRKGIVDAVLSKLSENVQEQANGKVSFLPTVSPRPIELQRIIDLRLVAIDECSRSKLRCQEGVDGLNTDIVSSFLLPLNSLLHGNDEIRNVTITTTFNAKEACARIEGNRHDWAFGGGVPSIELNGLIGDDKMNELIRSFDGSPLSAMNMHQGMVGDIVEIVNRGRSEYLKQMRKEYWKDKSRS
ncbi:Uncharacterised protein [uncultured archaeon]|nr:Uncharacterised protein [uncultured archaeon]